jgi:hypothetical protein
MLDLTAPVDLVGPTFCCSSALSVSGTGTGTGTPVTLSVIKEHINCALLFNASLILLLNTPTVMNQKPYWHSFRTLSLALSSAPLDLDNGHCHFVNDAYPSLN